MRKKGTSTLLLFIAVLLVGCQQALATVTPSTVPTSIAVLPSPTLPPAPKTSDGRTLPVVAADVPRITPQELKDLLASARNVVVVDVRGHDAYAGGHILGALDLPYADIEAGYHQLPRNTKIVFYCA